MIMYLRIAWTDIRLNYPKDEEADFVSLNVEMLERIWVPDIYPESAHRIETLKLLQKLMGIVMYRNKDFFSSSK